MSEEFLKDLLEGLYSQFVDEPLNLPLNKKPVALERLFKTEICWYWKKSHYCPRGEKCWFAHGFQELRPRMSWLGHNFQTHPCFAYQNGLHCPWGSKCRYRHQEPLAVAADVPSTDRPLKSRLSCFPTLV